MTSASIARLRDGNSTGGRTWAMGRLAGDDATLERFSDILMDRWRGGDRLVVLGNMLGEAGSPTRTLDRLLWLRRKLLAKPGAEAEDFVFLRGALEEMWHRVLQLQFAMSPLDVLDWMLARGLAATIEAYGHSVAEGRAASRNGPLAIARWSSRRAHRRLLRLRSRASSARLIPAERTVLQGTTVLIFCRRVRSAGTWTAFMTSNRSILRSA